MEEDRRDEDILSRLRISRELSRETLKGLKGYASFRKRFKSIIKIIEGTRHRTLVVIQGSNPVRQGVVVAAALAESIPDPLPPPWTGFTLYAASPIAIIPFHTMV